MRPDFDNPNYWKSLYKRPSESNTQGVVAGSTEVEAGDLEAELDPYAAETQENANIDHAAVMQIVDDLVEKRLQALVSQGWGPNAGGTPSTPRPAPAVAPPPPPKQAPPRPPAPRQQTVAPFQDPPPQRQQQATAPFQDPPPQRRPTPPPQPRPTPPPAAKPAAKPGVGAAMWGRVPRMPGGQASLFKAGDLGQEAIQLLVMVDGNTSLRGLRQLVPQMDDQAFLGIIRSAIKKGILDIS